MMPLFSPLCLDADGVSTGQNTRNTSFPVTSCVCCVPLGGWAGQSRPAVLKHEALGRPLARAPPGLCFPEKSGCRWAPGRLRLPALSWLCAVCVEALDVPNGSRRAMLCHDQGLALRTCCQAPSVTWVFSCPSPFQFKSHRSAAFPPPGSRGLGQEEQHTSRVGGGVGTWGSLAGPAVCVLTRGRCLRRCTYAVGNHDFIEAYKCQTVIVQYLCRLGYIYIYQLYWGLSSGDIGPLSFIP